MLSAPGPQHAVNITENSSKQFISVIIYAEIMPLKKRNIVSTQRSAFWPCGSCRRNCKSESICCDACRRWHHTGCEDLTASEFKFFNESDAPYTCNDCSAIEIGNSPYNYLYALTRLRQVNIINIIKLCRQSTRLCPLYSA